MKKFLVLLILIVAGGLFWFFNPADGKHVTVVKPKTMPAVQAVYATGTVEAVRMVSISPKVTARLLSLETDEGAQVGQGQLLAQMEDSDVQESVRDLQAKADLAQKDLSRAQKLAKTGALSKEALDQARAAYKSATASLERAKAELGYLQLVAPESGTIIRRDGEIGEMITVGTPVFWMNGGNEIRIETEVDEEDIGLVEIGQRVVISADAFPGRTFEGAVSAITPKGDPVARSYRVRVSLKNDTPLMIGMTAETNIITQTKESALMAPVSAISNGHILKISHGKAENTAVETGIKTPDAVEILEGLGEGDTIAQIYDATLLDAKTVKAKSTEWKTIERK